MTAAQFDAWVRAIKLVGLVIALWLAGQINGLSDD